MAQCKLNQLASYRQVVGCLTELGEVSVDVDAMRDCKALLELVLEVGVVLARCDLHRRMPG